MKKLCIVGVLLAVGAGCSMKHPWYKIQLSGSVNKRELHEQEMLAKFSDLPDAPFQMRLQEIMVSAEHIDQVQIVYATSMTIDDVRLFYEQQMERLGWDMIGQCQIGDCLLHFSKPEQLCSILIRSRSVDIYLCNKKRGA